MTVTGIENVEEFQRTSKEKLAVFHFYASWAKQCNQIDDVLMELEKKNSDVKFYRIEAEKLPDISYKYNITAVPTIIFMSLGKQVDRVDGTNVADINMKLKKWSARHHSPSELKKEDLSERLVKLIKADTCMLFMKGTPSEPRCGFSKQIVALLNGMNAKYSTFNILSDNEIREGLKKYSDWPTYPQVYVNGELIGGLDIVKEMVESGELAQTIPVKESIESKLKELIKKDRVMLFMKGTPSEPRCGFSKQTISLLDSTNAKYSTFNILEDNEVREGLKKYSDWPTYPQLYVDGQLMGGLDILKEMEESGELAKTLNKESADGSLNSILTKAPIMVFVEGEPAQPHQLISLLDEFKITYDTFDVLNDEGVREDLKEYSKVNMYPQVYVKGKLIGGLDEINELKDNGKLREILNVQ